MFEGSAQKCQIFEKVGIVEDSAVLTSEHMLDAFLRINDLKDASGVVLDACGEDHQFVKL